jgi:hypothetical protein
MPLVSECLSIKHHQELVNMNQSPELEVEGGVMKSRDSDGPGAPAEKEELRSSQARALEY